MYTLTITDEGGKSLTVHNVLDYDFVDEDNVQTVAEQFGKTLTKAQLVQVQRRCWKAERFPDNEDLTEIVKEVLDETNS